MAAIRRHFRRGTDPYFFVLISTSHVPSFMLLSENARFFLKFLHIRPTIKQILRRTMLI